MLTIDHLLWAVPELNTGIDLFETLTGARAVRGGSHPGRGTHNALVPLGAGRYLEIISCDPEQDLESIRGDGLGPVLKNRSVPGLFTFAVKYDDIAHLKSRAELLNIDLRGPKEISRRQPSGEILTWRLCHTDKTAFDRCVPFYIDWGDTPHPASSPSQGLVLKDFAVIHPNDYELRHLYNEFGIDVPVVRGDRPGMRAVVGSPKGDVVLTSVG